MKKFRIILGILLIVILTHLLTVRGGMYPSSLHENETTTCEEFSRYARFNPYSVLGSEWMAFYYWGPPQSLMFVNFTVPTQIEKAFLNYILDGHVLEPINWTARSLLMRDLKNNTFFLVEKNDRGHYIMYVPVKGLEEGDLANTFDIRMKQTGDNRYLGIMTCDTGVVLLFARIHDVPKKKYVHEEATKLGYRGRQGRSYLYQGHHWMPIPEAEDWHFELAMKERYLKKLNKV